MANEGLDLSDSSALTINVSGAGGRGIETNTTGNVNANVTVNVNNASGGSALVVNGETKEVIQSGALKSKSTTNPVVDINNGYVEKFTNTGHIEALNDTHVAVYSSTGNGIDFTNATGGDILGQVNLLSGNNNVTLQTASTGTDFYVANNGNNNFILKDVAVSETNLFATLNGGVGSGVDTLKLDNSHHILNYTNTLNNLEKIYLTNNSTLTLNGVSNQFALGDNANDAANTGYIIDSGSTLSLKETSDTTFKSHLEGSGELLVNTGSNNFNFTDNNKTDSFNGSVHLKDSKFELAGINTTALTQATLKAGVIPPKNNRFQK